MLFKLSKNSCLLELHVELLKCAVNGFVGLNCNVNHGLSEEDTANETTESIPTRSLLRSMCGANHQVVYPVTLDLTVPKPAAAVVYENSLLPSKSLGTA